MAQRDNAGNKTITLTREVKRRLSIAAINGDTNLKAYIEGLLTTHAETLEV